MGLTVIAPVETAGKVSTGGTPAVSGPAAATLVIGPQRAQKVLDGLHRQLIFPAHGAVALHGYYPLPVVRIAPKAKLTGQPVRVSVTLHVVPHAVLTGQQPHLGLLLGSG